MIPQRGKHLTCPVNARIDPAGCDIQQVWSTEIADEDKVPAEHETWLSSLGTIGDQKREVFWRMAWCMDGFKRDVAQCDLMAVFNTDGVIKAVSVDPVGSAFVRNIDLCSGSVC